MKISTGASRGPTSTTSSPTPVASVTRTCSKSPVIRMLHKLLFKTRLAGWNATDKPLRRTQRNFARRGAEVAGIFGSRGAEENMARAGRLLSAHHAAFVADVREYDRFAADTVSPRDRKSTRLNSSH